MSHLWSDLLMTVLQCVYVGNCALHVKCFFLLRPICLPCTVETNVALRLPRDATCEKQGTSTKMFHQSFDNECINVNVFCNVFFCSLNTEQLLLRERTESVSFLRKTSSEIIHKDTWVHRENSVSSRCLSCHSLQYKYVWLYANLHFALQN